jgi:hypothetical protein
MGFILGQRRLNIICGRKGDDRGTLKPEKREQKNSSKET